VSFDFRIPVTPETLNKVSRIDRFRGQWPSITAVPAERLNRMRDAATVRSVASSCRLSGMPVNDNDVAAVLRDESATPDAKAIKGYAAGLELPFPGNDSFVDQELLQLLNGTILGEDGLSAGGSPWREQEMNREAFDADGKALGWVFPTLPPRMIDEKTDELLTWLEFELRKGERHPLLIVGAFVLGFLAISPFEHGNGRTSRALVRHLLIRAGYAHLPFASFEGEIEADRPAYLNALFQARSGVWAGEADLQPWLDFFLAALERHRMRVETKLALEQDALAFPPLQREILEAVREHGSVNAALLLKATGANRNTLKDNLRRMVNRGVLERTGQKRGTRYRLAAPGALSNRPIEIPD
jgi:Fic family protein